MLWALSILGLLFALAVASRLSAQKAVLNYPPRGKFSSRGVHYDVTGEGAAVVLIHGSDGCLQDFDPLIGELSGHYRVIVYDRPGHGYSPAPGYRPWRVSSQANELRLLLNELGIERVIVVGHSWGAAVALAFAQRFPKRTSCVLTLGGWMFASRPSTPLLYVPLIPLVGRLVSATLLLPSKRFLVLSSLREAFYPRSVDHEYRRLANALWQRYSWQTVHFAHENTSAMRELKRLARLYNRIEAHTEIMFGLCDRAVDAQVHSRKLTEYLRTFNIEELEKAGHELHRFYQHSVRSAIIRATKTESVDDDRLHEALMEHGDCPDCWQSTNRSMEIVYEHNAVFAGVTCGSCWVSAGEPICGDPVQVAKRKSGVCWFGVSTGFKDDLCADGEHSAILIGSHPVWNPKNWGKKTLRHASLRTQIRRAAKKGVVITETASTVGLEECQQEWLGRLAISPLKFLTEPVDFENADGRQFFVATQNDKVVGYLVACPIPATSGRLVEEIARRPDAPNGTTEALIAHAMEAFAKENVESVTLGLAPLSRLGAPNDALAKGAVGLALKWMKVHGRRFYNFEGIESYKAKMQPDEWIPVYAVVRGQWKLRHIGAIVEAFTGETPMRAIVRFTWTAFCQELRWMVDKRKR